MFFHTFRNVIQRSEEILLSLILVVLIALACFQIILRLFFDSGIIWVDPLLRYLTLWGGMLGAVLAVSQEKHISLDIINTLLSREIQRYLKGAIYFICSIICGLLCYAALRFIQDEMAFSGNTILAIPSWGWNLIFPVSFGIMTLRFFIGAILQIFQPGSSVPSTRSDRS